MMVNAFTVVAKLRAAKGKGDTLAAFLVEQASAVRQNEPGCLAYRVHRSTTDPELFLFYEMYVDEAAFALHQKSQHMAGFRQRREQQGLTEGAVQVEFYRSSTE
jgi:quinol monooxygenase YgiN